VDIFLLCSEVKESNFRFSMKAKVYYNLEGIFLMFSLNDVIPDILTFHFVLKGHSREKSECS
jgi:hypothetical protein